MLWATFCHGIFGFLRAGEFTVNSPFNPDFHLTVSDIQADSLFNPRSFRVYIKCSKMDPFCQGCYIYIIHLCGSTPGPMFLLSDGTPLSHQWLSLALQSILSSVGVPGCFSGHSFRIGAATSAASCGIKDHLITRKTLGRWSSDAYQIYICTPVCTLVGVANQLS